MVMEPGNIIIFDGICNFCNGSVNFIIKRDPEKKFMFSPMQSEKGKELIKKYDLNRNADIDTLLLVRNGRIYVRTEAAFEIASDLSGGWKYLRVLRVIPVSVRDWFYKKLAKNRYKLFGRSESCMIPSPELRDRFLK